MAPPPPIQLDKNDEVLVFRGTLVHTPAYGQVDFLLDKIVVVSEGRIIKICAGSEEQTVLDIWGVEPGAVRRLQVSTTCAEPIFSTG
jgi:hypothetical protein